VYGVYEISRGLFAGDAPAAIRHAKDIAAVERSVHLFIERDLQRWAHSIGGMLGLFGVLYLTLHLAVDRHARTALGPTRHDPRLVNVWRMSA
jgi:hypothetical protein